MKRRLLAMAMMCAMAVSLISGCGQSNESTTGGNDDTKATNSDTGTATTGSSEEITITFGIHVANPKSQEAVTYEIVEAFNEKYDGQYQVEFVAADTETHSTNMKLQATDGTLPEIFWLDSSEAPEFSEAGYLLDLSDFLEQYPDAAAALDASVKEAFYSSIQYGLPYQCNVEGFFYNKELFAELGIDEPVSGTTFEELLEIISACNKAGYTTIAQGCLNSSYAVWGYLAMLERYGYSEYIDDILNGDENFNNENLLACFEKFKELGEAGAFSGNMSTQEYFDAKETFTSGQAAFFNSGAWDCAELDEKMGDTVGFWWGPTFSESSFNQEVSMKVPSAPLCVSAAVTEDEATQEAVYKFLEFYYSEEAAVISYAGAVFPATNFAGIEIGETQYALSEVVARIEDGWTSPASQPDQILTSALQEQLYDSIFGVLLGNYTPSDALDKLDQQLQY